MTCPACSATFAVTADIAGLTTCPDCDASLVIATGQRSTSADTLALSQGDLNALRQARSVNRRQRGEPQRRTI